MASRLNDLEGPGVLQISFRILANAQDIEFSGLHSGIRGALTGKGTIDVQIELTCPGPMTKADAEGRCEKLPTLHQASYSATMRIAPRESCSGMKNAMSVLDRQVLDTLTKPGFRLPILSDWLQHEVWTMERYQGWAKTLRNISSRENAW